MHNQPSSTTKLYYYYYWTLKIKVLLCFFASGEAKKANKQISKEAIR